VEKGAAERDWAERGGAATATPPTMAVERFDTAGDRVFSFIERVPVERSFFGGELRLHQPDKAVVVHEGEELVPLFSVVDRSPAGGTGRTLVAAGRHNSPDLVALCGAEPQTQQAGTLLSLGILLHCRARSCRCVLRLERCQPIAGTVVPSAAFLREALSSMPAAGVAAVAIFPTRNVNVLRAVRALTCVARLFADLNFIAFQDAAALRLWLAENDGPLRAGAASALNLAVPTGGSLGMDHLLARFCTLAADWPGDCAELEPMLAAEHVGEAQASELLLAGAPTPKHREEEATVGTSKRWAGC
jgi:hypothetical protein